ncbi:MAG TPA: ATP-binding protein, partial [Fervidobacterium sp.]|nr:ATP-binding protein [Fervidobacterium sp.]
MKFYNRSNELQFFDKLRLQKGKRFIVIYGRRRIGKTTLIKRAFEGLGAFYYYVEVMKEETLLRELSFTFLKAFYTDWFNLFSAIFERYEYVIFDEFQNFYKVSPNIMYALQHAWDENTHDTKLIVLGSYVGLMKNIFIDEKMPLFGRSDNVIKIKEFTLKDSIAMLQDFGYTMQEAIQIYAIVGGIPRYLWLFERKAPLSELIYDIFIDDFAPLKEEARNILITEFGSEHKSYFSILQALSGSSKSLAEITEQTGIEKT